MIAFSQREKWQKLNSHIIYLKQTRFCTVIYAKVQRLLVAFQNVHNAVQKN